jgi:hypothetical protein
VAALELPRLERMPRSVEVDEHFEAIGSNAGMVVVLEFHAVADTTDVLSRGAEILE